MGDKPLRSSFRVHNDLIVRRRMRGDSWTAIAEEIGCSQNTLREVRARYSIDEKVGRRIRDAAERVIAKFAGEVDAVSTQVLSIAKGTDPELNSTQLAAGKYVLDNVLKAAAGPVSGEEMPPQNRDNDTTDQKLGKLSNDDLSRLAAGEPE